MLSELVSRAIVNRCAEREVEYRYVFRNIIHLLSLPRHIRREVKILDVGCCESNLSRVLAELGFDVYGIDIRYCDIAPARLVQNNVLTVDFDSEMFNIVIAVSTVEHVGLDCYGQNIIDHDGDVKTMDRIWRWLCSNGIAIVTVPFGKPHHPEWFERVYNFENISRIVGKFKVLNMEVYCCEDGVGGNIWNLCYVNDVFVKSREHILNSDCVCCLTLCKCVE